MTLDDLRIFAAVCAAGSLSAVARDLGITQPAVSQHVRRLEHELDVVLFERGRRGVTPTAAGRSLRAAAIEATGALDASRRELERLRLGYDGSLRVATGGTTLRHFMARPLTELRRRHPDITFEYVSAVSTAQCLDAVRTDRADLAFVTLAGHQDLEHRPAVRTPWVVVAPADHPVARRSSIDPARLRSLATIAMPASATSRAQLEDGLAAHGVRLHVSATVDDWETAVQLAELGLGAAVVPALWVHDLSARPSLRAVRIRGLDAVTFGWAARHWKALPSYVDTFVGLVNEGFARLEPEARAEIPA
jgi:DNA-binding transcriptional LysR family regulator